MISEKRFGELQQSVLRRQAHEVAYNYILLEIATELAQSKPDPNEFVSTLLKRALARHEFEVPLAEKADPVGQQTDWMIRTFFNILRQRVT
jgi:hypothetical protein